ncbi:unnamed protein product [Urochloa humidicola]
MATTAWPSEERRRRWRREFADERRYAGDGLTSKGGGGGVNSPTREGSRRSPHRGALFLFPSLPLSRSHILSSISLFALSLGRAREGTVGMVRPGKGSRQVPAPCRRLVVRGSGSLRGRRCRALLCSSVGPCQCRRQDRKRMQACYNILQSSPRIRLGSTLAAAIAKYQRPKLKTATIRRMCTSLGCGRKDWLVLVSIKMKRCFTCSL